MTYEDFTTYTEKDDNNYITVTAYHIVAILHKNLDEWVYDDKTADHFGDFEHLIDLKPTEMGSSGDLAITWMLTNAVNDWKDLRDANEKTLSVDFFNNVGTKQLRLCYFDGSTLHKDTYDSVSEGTTYYCKIERASTTLTCKIYPSDADRTADTNIIATLTVSSVTTDTFRFVFACNTYNSGSGPVATVEIDNLDLQEGGGQTYEINVDAVVKASAEKSLQTTYNIEKDATVTSQAVEASESTFNIPKDAIVKSLADLGIETTFSISKDALVQAVADVVVEKVAGQLIEIFKDAVVQAQASFALESTFNINKDAISEAAATVGIETIFNVVKDAIVKASAFPQVLGVYPINVDALVQASATASLHQTLGISKDAVVVAVSTPLIQSTFNISPDAVVKVLAEVTVVKEGEAKVTKLFLILGNIGIQLTGD